MVTMQIPAVALTAIAKKAAEQAFGLRIKAERAVTRRNLSASEHRELLMAEGLAISLARATGKAVSR
jgi:type IV secretory pathway TrbD component